MVLDFSEIKRVVSRWIDEQLDHRMLLRRDDPAVLLLQQLGEPMFLMDVNPTAENIAKLIMQGANSLQIAAIAQKEGMRTLRISGLEKARLGVTSLAVINRITTN